jgi:hypothetical protein
MHPAEVTPKEVLENSNLQGHLMSDKKRSCSRIAITNNKQIQRMNDIFLQNDTIDRTLDDDKNIKNKSVGEGLHGCKRHG